MIKSIIFSIFVIVSLRFYASAKDSVTLSDKTLSPRLIQVVSPLLSQAQSLSEVQKLNMKSKMISKAQSECQEVMPKSILDVLDIQVYRDSKNPKQIMGRIEGICKKKGIANAII